MNTVTMLFELVRLYWRLDLPESDIDWILNRLGAGSCVCLIEFELMRPKFDGLTHEQIKTLLYDRFRNRRTALNADI